MFEVEENDHQSYKERRHRAKFFFIHGEIVRQSDIAFARGSVEVYSPRKEKYDPRQYPGILHHNEKSNILSEG